jgi:predicted phosphoribosyltransferase
MDSMFLDRREAGRRLAERVSSAARGDDVLVLGLPRGGVIVASEVARASMSPLDVFVIRKLEVPDTNELAIGAISAGGVRVLDSKTIAALQIPQDTIEEIARTEALQLARIERHYRGGRPAARIRGRKIILVDDGLSPPSFLGLAPDALRAYRPARIVVAMPTTTPDIFDRLKGLADDVICALPPDASLDTSRYYEDDSPPSDRDIRHLLARANQNDDRHHAGGP